MFRRLSRWLVALTSLAVLMPPAAAKDAPAGWEQIRDEDGIKVYRRDVAGSNLREVRGVGVVPAAIPKLVALLSDIEKMPLWTDNCIRAELIQKNFYANDLNKSIGDYFEIGYAVNRVPWPLKYRDYILRSNMALSPPEPHQPRHLLINSFAVTDPKHPENKEFVRVPTMNITVDMVPVAQAKDQTLIEFTIHIDPGGIIPDLIVNQVSKLLPFRTLKNIAKLATTDSYDRGIEKLVQYHYERAQLAVLP